MTFFGTHVLRSVYVCHLFNDCDITSAELQDIARLMLTSLQNLMQAYLTASAEKIAQRGAAPSQFLEYDSE